MTQESSRAFFGDGRERCLRRSQEKRRKSAVDRERVRERARERQTAQYAEPRPLLKLRSIACPH